MAREIKFRAWDDAEKKWLLGYDYPNLGGFSLCGEVVLFGEWGNCFDQYLFERNGKKSSDLIVEQFTGLKDKNGRDIYEGDICKCIYYKHVEKDLSLIQKVVYDHASFIVIVGDLKPDLESESYADCPLSWVNKIEVIGNIHENSELLNQP